MSVSLAVLSVGVGEPKASSELAWFLLWSRRRCRQVAVHFLVLHLSLQALQPLANCRADSVRSGGPLQAGELHDVATCSRCHGIASPVLFLSPECLPTTWVSPLL